MKLVRCSAGLRVRQGAPAGECVAAARGWLAPRPDDRKLEAQRPRLYGQMVRSCRYADGNADPHYQLSLRRKIASLHPKSSAERMPLISV